MPRKQDRKKEPAVSVESTLHAVASGRVQGVGYRFFVVRTARELGLTGTVKNRLDGQVEVWARGPRPQLLAFELALKEGPSQSRVENLLVGWDTPMASMDEFIIDF